MTFVMYDIEKASQNAYISIILRLDCHWMLVPLLQKLFMTK